MATDVTLNELVTTVRELTFDRFIIPAFSIKAIPNKIMSVTNNMLVIKDAVATEGGIVEELVVDFLTFDTMEKIMNELIEKEIVVAYTPYFRGGQSSKSLIKMTDRLLNEDCVVFRKDFFDDEDILKLVGGYYRRVLGATNVELSDTIVSKLKRPSEEHLAIWVSYFLVEKRRMYEAAANSIGQTYTDGSDYVGSIVDNPADQVTVNIGSVFSISENQSTGFFQEDFNRLGSENVWGDRFSFWFKLMCYLRQLLEETFGDYSLRKQNIMSSQLELVRDLDFRSYYDSYPFTLSPLSRGILSKTP